MITATRNWFKRNRTGLAVGAGLLGASYLVGQYVLSKVTEARQRMSDDRLARENLRRRFEQNQEDCTYTVLALLPTATDNLLKAIPVEELTRELQKQRSERLARSTANSEIAPSEAPSAVDGDGASLGSSGFIHTSQITHEGSGESSGKGSGLLTSMRPAKSKAQLWNELKITSITRAFTLIYTLALLTLLTRIQLNLLGRRNYLSSVVSLASPPQEGSEISLENRDDDNLDQDYGNDFETNRKYLTFSWWLLHRGWRDVLNRVESAVKETFGPVGLKENVSFEKLSELTLEVRKKVEGASEVDRRTHKWLRYMLPPRHEEELVLKESGVLLSTPSNNPLIQDTHTSSTSLRRLLDETSDLIDSPTFTHVLTLLLDAGFSHLIDDKLADQAYKIPLQSQSISNPSHPPLFSDPRTALLSSDNRVEELPDAATSTSAPNAKQTTTKLATILAVFTRQAHAIGSGGNINSMMSSAVSEIIPGISGPSIKDTNEYLAAMEGVRDLEAFAAVVYSSNFELEGVESGDISKQVLGSDATGRRETFDPGADQSMVAGKPDVQGLLESAWGKALVKDDDPSTR